MKRLYTALVGIFFVEMLFAANFTDKKGRKQGEWSKNYPNGQVMYTGEFKDDQPVGEFKHYYENGSLKIIQTYEANNRSQVTMYDTDGETPIAKGTYVGKAKEAEWTYYVDGKISLLEVYNNGKKNGVSKSYSKDGAILEEVPYVNGVIDGMHKRFLPDGSRYSETSYKNGVEHGSYKLYEGHDFPVIEGVNKNGKRDGDWILKDDKGILVDVLKYNDGVLLNDKELKKKYSEEFDKNEGNKGRFQELESTLMGTN